MSDRDELLSVWTRLGRAEHEALLDAAKGLAARSTPILRAGDLLIPLGALDRGEVDRLLAALETSRRLGVEREVFEHLDAEGRADLLRLGIRPEMAAVEGIEGQAIPRSSNLSNPAATKSAGGPSNGNPDR